jgi:hypothetical protein
MRLSALVAAALLVACGRSSPSSAGGGDGGTGVDAGTGTSFAASLETSLPLTPAFSPDIHDYCVQCALGTTPLSVTVTAPTDATVAFVQPVTTSPAASQTESLQLVENQAVVVSASSGAGTTEYWVRCLPHDFPKLSMVAHPDAGTPTPGYYLVGDTESAVGESSYAMVVDVHGVPVWYSPTLNGNQPVNVESLTPNTVSFVAYLYYTFANTSWSYEVHRLDTNDVELVKPVGEPLDIHELQVLPNGDYLVLSDPITTGVDLTGLGTFGPNESMIGCDVQEVTPSGATQWQWSAIDHFDPVKDTTFLETEDVSGADVVDPFHCNSIDVASNGDLLISSRHMDSVFLVSKASGNVVWKMGGSPYTKDGAAYLQVTGDPQTAFYRQHDARFLPDGQISVFDDATDTPGRARGVVYSYDVSAGTASFVWQYAGAVSSAAMGSFRVMPDGSRIIGWGEGGTPQLVFTEVDASGNDLLDLDFTDGDESYRALKVPLTQLDLGLMRSSVSTLVSTDDAGVSDGSQGTTTSPRQGAGCSVLSGSGASQECTYSASPTCSIQGGAPGSCPAAGLYGCCVDVLDTDAGEHVVGATCYYSASAGQPAASQCAFDAYEGMPYEWQTHAP